MSKRDGLDERLSPGKAPEINPRLRRTDQPDTDPAALVSALRDGDRAALARAISLVESSRAEDRPRILSLLDGCQDRSGSAYRIGMSGPPGAGKSTLIDRFGRLLLDAGHRVAVLAVDPSSDVSGGSILGDKTRMGTLAADDRAFIRPSPTSGALGGVARATRAAITLCEAAGYDIVLIETVGVGQSEFAVRHMVDLLLLLVITGAGDELQGIKRGILEMADAILVTKADGRNQEAARVARNQLSHALHLFPDTGSGWTPRVQTVSAHAEEGLDALSGLVSEFRAETTESGWWGTQRTGQRLRWLRDEFDALLREAAIDQIGAEYDALEGDVRSGVLHPYRAADRLIERVLGR